MKRPLLAIFLIVLVDIMGFTIILPLLPFYTERYGGSPAVYGTLVTTYAFCQLISGPLLGQISDRVGRKPLLLVSQVGTFVGFIILAYAHTLSVIFLSRVIDGMTAGNLSLAQAYISDVTEAKDRAKAFGLIGISFGIGFLVGPAVSGYLSQFGYQYPPLAASVLSFASIMGTSFLLPKVKRPEGAHEAAPGKIDIFHWRRYSHFFKNPELRRFLIQFFLFSFAFSMFVTGFALFVERRFFHNGQPFGPKEVGYLFAYSGFLGIIIQGGLLGRLVKQFGERKIILAGFLAMVLGYILLSFTYPLWLLLITLAITAFGSGVVRPSLTSMITQNAGRHEQGVVLGLNQSLYSIAQIVGPLLAGALISIGHLMLWAWATAFFALAGMSLCRLQSPKPETQSI